jgi:DNA invertase Pin-like site-specific DNA recombinase
MAKTKRAALYLRVSTDGQSVENQRLALEAVAAQRGWSVAAAHDDNGISGAKGRDCQWRLNFRQIGRSKNRHFVSLPV